MTALVLLSEPADGVVTLTLNRPEKKNALSIAVRDEFSDALDALASDHAVKVVVVTGAGDTFSAGFDLREFDRLDDEEFAKTLWASSDRWHRTCLEFPLPLVAAVNGAALAGGFDLAVMCDVRIAAETARFAHPESTFSDVVYGPLHDLVGAATARDLCFSGRAIDAREAHRLHLVIEVVAASELPAAAAAYGAQIARAPRDVLRRTKAKAVRRSGVVAGPTLDL
jgi:enoyl-CoA hydratase